MLFRSWLALRFVDDLREPERSTLDVVSFTLMGMALGGLVFGFETGGRGMLPLSVALTLLAAGSASLVAYALHARGSTNPAIDLGLLRGRQVFSAAILGGALLRMALGAQPVVLPLLLQLGFGMSALWSGSLTIFSAIGAITPRLFLRQIVRLAGFRRVLVWATVAVSANFLIFAVLWPGVPIPVLIALLLLSGMGRTTLMLSLNTLGYAEVPPERMSRATTIVSMSQQLFNSLGVSVGATLLSLTLALRGASDLGAADFWPTYVVLAALPLLSLFYFVPLPSDVGDELSGHRGG